MELSAVIGMSLVMAVWLGTVNIWLGTFLAMATAYHVWPVYNSAGYTSIHNLILAAGLILFIKYAEKDIENKLLDMMVAVSCFNLLTILIAEAGIQIPYQVWWGQDCEGIMANRNESAALFAFTAFAGFRPKRWWFLAVVALGLILTRTSGVVFGLGFALMFYFKRLFDNKKLFFVYLGIIAGLILYIYFVDVPGIRERGLMWTGTAWAILQRPLGWGLGRWPLIYNHSPHNEFLRAMFEMGILAGIVIIGYAVSLFMSYRGRMTKENSIILCSLITTAFISGIGFQLHIGATGLIACLWIGLAERRRV